jgi:hypothetical protein
MTVAVAGSAASAGVVDFLLSWLFVSFDPDDFVVDEDCPFAADEASGADFVELGAPCAGAGVGLGLGVCATAVPAASSPIMASFSMREILS